MLSLFSIIWKTIQNLQLREKKLIEVASILRNTDVLPDRNTCVLKKRKYQEKNLKKIVA